MLSLEGQQLGNYDVIRRIRAGGMGAVYEGRQRTAFGRRVAIKVILGDYAADRDMRRRFAREARTIARLHHPHILPLIEFGDEKGILYLVMPFIDGGTLTSYLRRSLPGLDEVTAIYQQLLDAVEYAHDEGLIHRDIKSSNVLLEERRNGAPYAYLADFGLVRNARQAANSQAGKPIPLEQVPGTPHYMAPEQTRGIVTPLTDIYALGVLLYQMLTGELPYNDPDEVRVIQMHLQDPVPSASERDASIPRALDDVIRKAMAKRSEDRYQNVASLREAFLTAYHQGTAADIPEDGDDELFIEEVEEDFSPPLRRVPTPLTLQPPPPAPEPQVLSEDAAPRPPRTQRATVPIAVREEREKQRVTDTVKVRPRITEEPMPQRRRAAPKVQPRSARGRIIATMLVPLVLIILLLMPRVFGFSFFPAGFPLFGTPPVATVFITAQSKVLQDKYVLTASPKVKQPDLVTHTIPDREVQSDASASSTVPTTGTKNQGGAPASGNVVFINNGNDTVNVPAGFVLTAPSGVRFQVVQSVNVPSPGDGGNGKVTTTAVAVQPGAAGNIAAHTLDGTCCNNSLTVKNNSAFSGGVDPQVMHVVAQADIDTVRTTLLPKLQAQIVNQIQQQLAPDEVIAGQPGYQVNTSSNVAVGDQADQAQVTVHVQGSAIVYNRTQAAQTAAQLLHAFATQTLDSNYQVQTEPKIIAQPTAQAGADGSAYISVSVRGQWSYLLSQTQINQWRQSIRGATSAAALAYLNSQSGIAAVQINLPFGTDHLPTTNDDIKMVIVGQ